MISIEDTHYASRAWGVQLGVIAKIIDSVEAIRRAVRIAMMRVETGVLMNKAEILSSMVLWDDRQIPSIC